MVTVVTTIEQICLCPIDITTCLRLICGTVATDRTTEIPQIIRLFLEVSQSRTENLYVFTVNMQHNMKDSLIYSIILLYLISSFQSNLFLVSQDCHGWTTNCPNQPTNCNGTTHYRPLPSLNK